MPIINTGNHIKPFNLSQPPLNSSDRTAHLKSKTKYAAATNLAQNGGILAKQNGSKYVGPVRTACSSLASAASYADLLDVTKGKYLLTPPPSSVLTTSFSPENGEIYYGNFAVTNYASANIPITIIGFPTIKIVSSVSYEYKYPNQLVATSSEPVPTFNNVNIIVDPEFRLFYDSRTCTIRNYFKNVFLDPNINVAWRTSLPVYGFDYISSKPYNQEQAQRIIANQAQSLRGFQYPTQVHFDLDNCDSKPSITPVAPDAPVISIIAQTANSATISWLHNFDGGSPIINYTVYVDGAIVATLNDPPPCLNTYTVTCGQEAWITASNCVPLYKVIGFDPSSYCNVYTSPESNHVFFSLPPCT